MRFNTKFNKEINIGLQSVPAHLGQNVKTTDMSL